MANTTRMGLFVARFIAFNLDRYAADPEKLALFTGLTESDLTFEAQTGVGAAIRSATVKSVSRNFIGVNQTWLPAELNNVKAYALTETEVAPDLATVLEKTMPGVYAYLDADGLTTKIVVLIDDKIAAEGQADAAKAAFLSGLKYDLLEEDITMNADSITVSAPCMYGDIIFRSAAVEVIEIPDTDYGQLVFPD